MPERSESPPPHVDDETFERYACGELNAEERARVEAHAARCADCDRVLRGLTMLRHEAAGFDATVPEHAASRPRWAIPLAIAAALTVAVVAPIAWTALHDRNGASAAREANTDAIDATVPQGAISGPAIKFEWRQWDGATRYEVRLFEADGTLVWSGSTGDTSIEVPSDLKLAPRKYYWQVRAIRGAAAESPLVPFTLTAPR
jgi:hypothetical protein